MNNLILFFASFLYCSFCFGEINDNTNAAIVEGKYKEPTTNSIIRIKVDKIAIDTDGLIKATEGLSLGIQNLSNSIENISKKGVTLTPKDRDTLILAAHSVKNASKAITKLAEQIPLTTKKITEELPKVIINSQQPIEKISESIQAASTGVLAITQSLPEFVSESKKLGEEFADAILIKVSIYTTVFFTLLLLIILAIVYFVYSKVLDPIITKLDEFIEVPAQLTEMTVYMKDTSENLLALSGSKNANLKNKIK